MWVQGTDSCGSKEPCIISAPLSGTNAKSAYLRVRAPQARAVGREPGGVMSSPSGSVARAPAASDFFRMKSGLTIGHRCVSTRLQRWADPDKSGTSSQKRDKRASRETVIFPRHVVKNRDCPGTSRTDDHLHYNSIAWSHFCDYKNSRVRSSL